MAFLDRFITQPEQRGLRPSILRNLAHVASSRAGFSSFDVELGLERFEERVGAAQVFQLLAEDLRRLIETYEHRIQVLDIFELTRPRQEVIRFGIRCTDAEGPWRIGISLNVLTFEIEVLELRDRLWGTS